MIQAVFYSCYYIAKSRGLRGKGIGVKGNYLEAVEWFWLVSRRKESVSVQCNEAWAGHVRKGGALISRRRAPENVSKMRK
jgi:hypothetical protein